MMTYLAHPLRNAETTKHLFDQMAPLISRLSHIRGLKVKSEYLRLGESFNAKSISWDDKEI